jgi:hypothetical protein
MSGTQELVYERSYDLWQQAGGPEGRSDEFWFAAERELEYGELESAIATVVEEAGILVPTVEERSVNAFPVAASKDV